MTPKFVPGSYQIYASLVSSATQLQSLKENLLKRNEDSLNIISHFHPTEHLPCKSLLSEILASNPSDTTKHFLSSCLQLHPDCCDQKNVPPGPFLPILFEFFFSQSYLAQFCAFFLLPFFFFLLLAFAFPFLQICL